MSDQDAIRVLLWSAPGSGKHYGGPGMSAFRLYSAARPGRFEISLAHGRPEQTQYDLFRSQTLIAPRPSSAWSMIRYLHRARQWLSANCHRFDVFHGLRAFHDTVVPAMMAHRRGVPAVVKVAGHQTDLSDKRTIRGILGLPRRRRNMLKQLDGVIAISRAIVSELVDYGIPETKVVYIPNGVDTSRFHPIADEWQRHKNRAELGWPELPTVLYVGGVMHRKRALEIAEAVGILVRRGLDCQVVFAGPDDYEPQYTQQIHDVGQRFNIQSRIIFHGFTPDIAKAYRAADVFALPSRSEGLPNALLEAMASGIPSIGTAISGITDLIDDGIEGRIITPTAHEVADSIAIYLENPKLAQQHGHAAREKVESQFSTVAVLDAHESLFRRLMDGGHAAT